MPISVSENEKKRIFWKNAGEWTISEKMTRQSEQNEQVQKQESRQETGNGNQMTAPRFKMGGDIRHS